MYNLLKRLERQGDIVAVVQEQPHLPERHVFHLTEQGRRRFEQWLDTPTGCSVRAIRVEFLTRLYFARLQDPARAIQLIEVQKAETRLGMEQLQSKLEQLPVEQVFNRLGLALRVRQLASVLDWLEECAALVCDA